MNIYEILQERFKDFDFKNHKFDSSNFEKVKECPYRIYDLLMLADDYSTSIDKSFFNSLIDYITKQVSLILKTGNGTLESPFMCNSVSDEYSILSLLSIYPQNQRVFYANSKVYDRYNVYSKRFDIKYIYFDVTHFIHKKYQIINNLYDRNSDSLINENSDIHFRIEPNKKLKIKWTGKMN